MKNNVATLAGKNYFEQGRVLYESGAILDVQRSGKAVTVRLANERGRFEEVTLTFREHGLRSKCSCPNRTASYCEHAVAALLKLCDENPEVAAYVDSVAGMQDDDSTVSFAAHRLLNETDVMTEDSVSDGNIWKSYAVHGANAKGKLQINIGDTDPRFETRWGRIEVTLTLLYKSKSYALGNIKVLLENGVGAAGMSLRDFTLQETQAMRFIMQYTDLTLGKCMLEAGQIAELFQMLAGCPRIYNTNGLVQVHPELFQLVFRVITGTGEKIETRPSLFLPRKGFFDAGKMSSIPGWGGCWFGVDNEYWWLPGVSESACIRSLLNETSMHLTAEELEALERETRAGIVPGTVTHGDNGEDETWSVSEGVCQPLAFVDWPEDKPELELRLAFEYDGVRIQSGDNATLWTEKGVVRRDFRREAHAEKEIRGAGFAPKELTHELFLLNRRRALWQVVVHGKLRTLRRDWKVFYTDAYLQRCMKCGDLKLEASTEDENDKTFGLRLTLKSDAGEQFTLSEVSRSVRSHTEHLVAESGALVRIPESAGKAIMTLQAYADEQKGNVFWFGRYASFPVFQAVAGFPGKRDAAWMESCKKLLTVTPGEFLDRIPEVNGELRDYQREGIAWLVKMQSCNFHGILADEMGLGKTVQALACVLQYKQELEQKLPSLIVCPTSLIDNWLAEAQRFTPQLRAVRVYGNKRESTINKLDKVDLAITSYALLRRDMHHYQKHSLAYLILDEAQHIKNPNTSNAKACKAMNAQHRVVLTGTPIENSTRELWSLFDFLCPGMLGNQRFFKENYDNGTERDLGKIGPRDLAKQVRPFILRRTKNEVFQQLPPKLEQTVFCELTESQRRIYQQIHEEARTVVETVTDGSIKEFRFELLALLLRMRQLCCHPALLPKEFTKNEAGELKSAKLELFREELQECLDDNHRVLVFSQFRSMLQLMIPVLNDLGINYEYLDGNTKDRQARVDRFNQDETLPVFLISLKAGGTGLNLTGADTVIHYDQWWNPMVEDQATDRTHRIGQKNVVTSMKLITKNTIEERILELQGQKRELFDQLIGAAPGKLDALSNEDLAFLLTNY